MAMHRWDEGQLQDMAQYRPGSYLHFPGSQPVSLDRKNLELLSERRYWVRSACTCPAAAAAAT